MEQPPEEEDSLLEEGNSALLEACEQGRHTVVAELLKYCSPNGVFVQKYDGRFPQWYLLTGVGKRN
tara:strand:+ start:997 stop:1194 length:198 start_codon:yes stop_codon:yes gene_type:complete